METPERYRDDLEHEGLSEGQAEDGAESMDVLCFRAAGRDFAFEVDEVEMIIRSQKITYVPRSDSRLVGVTSVRGKIMPVLDIDRVMTPQDEPYMQGVSQRAKIVIVTGPKGAIAFNIDGAMGIQSVKRSTLLPPPAHLTEQAAMSIRYVAPTSRGYVSIVHPEEILKFSLIEEAS